jgi:predicted RNA-binding Zn ribbon-like protein
MQEHGFPVGGESSIAIDLVDTIANAHTSPTDLLDRNPDGWWNLQSGRLPDSEVPVLENTKRLRAVLRDVFEAAIDGRLAGGRAVDELNRFANSVQSSPRLVVDNDTAQSTTRWHISRDGNPKLAAIAHDAIALLGDPVRRSQLRRCANPTCSMLFVAENPRRVWCASNVCGNRARVARHQQRVKDHPKE